MTELLPFNNMIPAEFEEFCFQLLREVGFINIDWRKGTGKNSSPSDGGRDIVAHFGRKDADGTKYLETWFIDCKHYKQGVPPEKISGLLAWATAERANVALIITSNFLSNPCKNFLKDYELNNRPPFRIQYWERPTLERLANEHDEFLSKFLRVGLRTEAELLAAEQEMFWRVWYERKLVLEQRIAEGKEKIVPDILAGMRKGMKEAEQIVGKENLGAKDDFDWGFTNGKLSALRGVLGDDWDMLDT